MVKAVWCTDFSWVNQFEASQGTFTDLVGRILSKPQVLELFATTAWFIWSHRNKSRLKECTLPISKLRESAYSYLRNYDSSVLPRVATKQKRQKWVPPKPREFKTNFDEAMFGESDEVGIEIVV